MKTVSRVRVAPNLALVKYWGKLDSGINIPATPSIGVCLDGLYSQTTISLAAADCGSPPDRQPGNNTSLLTPSIRIDGQIQPYARFAEFFEAFTRIVPQSRDYLPRLEISSSNNFPTAAGLASSSSGFGALCYALNHFFAAGLTTRQQSALARIGSGSAARTLYGGFVDFPDGSDYAEGLYDDAWWPDFRVVVLTVSTEKKPASSRSGMQAVKDASPFYPAWVKDSRQLYSRAKEALARRDFELLGETARLSYMRMFATMLGSDPPLLYWKPLSLEIIQSLFELRAKGHAVWETMDAGPQVKVLCPASETDNLTRFFASLPQAPLVLKPGRGPEIL